MTSTVQSETSAERKERKRKLEEDLAVINAAEEEENEKIARAAMFNQMPEKYRPLLHDVLTGSDDSFEKVYNELKTVSAVLERIRNSRMRKVAKARKTEGTNSQSV